MAQRLQQIQRRFVFYHDLSEADSSSVMCETQTAATIFFF